MDSQNPIRVGMFLPSAIILCVIGWGGLLFLLFFTLPMIGPRWLFFFFAVLALTGTALPLIAQLNIRFPSKPLVTPAVILREAILLGVYFPTLAWLQIGRVLTIGLAILLAAGLVILELILKIRERSMWKPQDNSENQ